MLLFYCVADAKKVIHLVFSEVMNQFLDKSQPCVRSQHSRKMLAILKVNVL